MTGIIDVHTHILPGIDDGARDWDESRRMLETAYSQGIRHIVATPHYSRRGLRPEIYELSARLTEEAKKIAPDFKQGQALTLEGTRCVLVEFDPQEAYHSLYQAVRKMTMARYIPVIAHVERYFCLREGKNLEELVQCGCRLQMNYSSLEGNGIWNREVRWCRRQVLEGRIHILGTDMHRMDYRKPDVRASLGWLEKHVGEQALKALVSSNADKILQKGKTGE